MFEMKELATERSTEPFRLFLSVTLLRLLPSAALSDRVSAKGNCCRRHAGTGSADARRGRLWTKPPTVWTRKISGYPLHEIILISNIETRSVSRITLESERGTLVDIEETIFARGICSRHLCFRSYRVLFRELACASSRAGAARSGANLLAIAVFSVV